MTTRYAIYYAPDPGSALWRFGSAVLGYDAVTGAPVDSLRPPGITAEHWAAHTADPRKYGFHATIKAPFALRAGASEAELAAALAGLAARLAPVPLGPASVHVVPSGDGGGFVAVMPDRQPEALGALERQAVVELDPWRAPLEPADRARRRPERLTERQRDRLDRYGYPYIFEEFRFHMTLTGRLEEPGPVARALQRAAEEAGALEGIVVDRLALFRQDGPGERFRIAGFAPIGEAAGAAATLPPQLGG